MSKHSLLARGGYIPLNKALMLYIENAAASLLLHYLIDVEDILVNRGDVDLGSWFYCTVQRAEDQIGVKRKQQEAAIKTLESLNLIKIDHKGIPRRRHLQINHKKIDQIASQSENARFSESANDSEVGVTDHPVGTKPAGQYGRNVPTRSEGPKGTNRTSQYGRNVPTGADETYQHSNNQEKKPKSKYVAPNGATDTNGLGLVGEGRSGSKQGARYKRNPSAEWEGCAKMAREAATKLHPRLVQGNGSARTVSKINLAKELDALLEVRFTEEELKRAVKWGIANYESRYCGSIVRKEQVREQIIKWDKQAQWMDNGQDAQV